MLFEYAQNIIKTYPWDKSLVTFCNERKLSLITVFPQGGFLFTLTVYHGHQKFKDVSIRANLLFR